MQIPRTVKAVVFVCLALAPLAACSAPTQDYDSVPLCDSVDVHCRCKLNGWILCGDTCVSPKLSHDNCGQCGNSCGSGVCLNGACAANCGSYPICGNACVDLMNDAANCGTCGHGCGAGEGCFSGSCATPCATGQLRCNGSCVDPQTDTENCGACGTVCRYECRSGTCQCLSSETNCSGFCVNTSSDSSNCGACGNLCSGGTSCAFGACQ
jgi:hypothetical protein